MKAHIFSPFNLISFLASHFHNFFSLSLLSIAASVSLAISMRLTKPMDEWITRALMEDQIVVELLLHIKHAGTIESENPTENLRWGLRQRRSRPSRLSVGGCIKKENDSARASPMTPLCWSGGSGSRSSTSPSAETADDFEDTSRQASCSTSNGSGSKALHTRNEFESCSSKRSKKNKTFSELKDAEKLQLKERFDLENKIANVQAKYDKRSVKNRSLKRVKLEYSDRCKTDLISKRTHLPSSISSVKSKQQKSESYRATNETKRSEEKGFFLPDLNMTPTEEDETLYGTI